MQKLDPSSCSPRKYIFRSNSEVYLKDTDMQDEEDLVMPPPFHLLPSAGGAPTPIMYAEATASDMAPSQTIPLTIDHTQMNNLTRNLMVPNCDQSIYVNTALY